MIKKRYWPEIYVDIQFLEREDLVEKVLRTDENTYNVHFEHPVLGDVVEVFARTDAQTLCLKSMYPIDMQSQEQIEIAKDYYNNFLLDGQETYLEYFNPEIGFFLQSRNVTELGGLRL